MNLELFKNIFEKQLLFNTYEVKAIFPDMDLRRLVEWQKKNYIIKLKKRWYYFPKFCEQQNSHFLAANFIYSPSYISLQSALSYYGLIPELIFTITSLSTGINKQYNTKIGTFKYNHLKPELFFGYKLIQFENNYAVATEKRHFKIAEIEKAILDYFYINTNINSEKDIAQVRLDPDIFELDLNKEKLMNYLSKFQNKALEKRIFKLLKILSNG